MFFLLLFLTLPLRSISVDIYRTFGAQSPIDQRTIAACSILRCLGRGRKIGRFASNFLNFQVILQGFQMFLRYSILNDSEMQVPLEWCLKLGVRFQGPIKIVPFFLGIQLRLGTSSHRRRSTLTVRFHAFVRVGALKKCGSLKSLMLWQHMGCVFHGFRGVRWFGGCVGVVFGAVFAPWSASRPSLLLASIRNPRLATFVTLSSAALPGWCASPMLGRARLAHGMRGVGRCLERFLRLTKHQFRRNFVSTKLS